MDPSSSYAMMDNAILDVEVIFSKGGAYKNAIEGGKDPVNGLPVIWTDLLEASSRALLSNATARISWEPEDIPVI